MQQRIYIDTSVLGGYFDEEFEEDTKLFFERIERKEFIIHLSEISKIELLPAPQEVRKSGSKNSSGLFSVAEVRSGSTGTCRELSCRKNFG